jgi:hypothetical protein
MQASGGHDLLAFYLEGRRWQRHQQISLHIRVCPVDQAAVTENQLGKVNLVLFALV